MIYVYSKEINCRRSCVDGSNTPTKPKKLILNIMFIVLYVTLKHLSVKINSGANQKKRPCISTMEHYSASASIVALVLVVMTRNWNAGAVGESWENFAFTIMNLSKKACCEKESWTGVVGEGMGGLDCQERECGRLDQSELEFKYSWQNSTHLLFVGWLKKGRRAASTCCWLRQIWKPKKTPELHLLWPVHMSESVRSSKHLASHYCSL